MNIQTNNTTLLALFFIYLVMMSGNINNLLNCNVQRLLKDSLITQHILVFFSIFIFTFILGWFLPSALIVGNYEQVEQRDKIHVNHDNDYIYSSFMYSLYIYAFFILSTKQSKTFIISFLFLLLLLIFFYLYYVKILDSSNITRNSITDFFISKERLQSLTNHSNVDKIFLLHNGISLGHIAIVINIIFGVYYYYLKQKNDHKNWSWIKFIFGVHKCRK